MDDRGLELLVVSDPSNMAWLTGYDGWSFYVHQCVLLAARRRSGVVRARHGRQRREAHRVHGARRHRRIRRPLRDVHRAAPDGLSERGHRPARVGRRSRIGVEMDNYYFSAAAYRSLETHLCDATLLDATGLVNWQRIVKSEAEIACMRNAARIVETDARAHPRRGRARHAQERFGGGDLPRGDYRRGGRRRRLSRPSCRCCRPASTRPPRTSPGTTSRCGRARRRSSR